MQLSAKQQKQFDSDRQTFIGIANDLGLYGVSLVDVNAAVYASILEIPLVTDDGDLTTLCNELSVSAICTLDLLKIMLDCAHIKIEQIRAIGGYWIQMSDCPRDFKEKYKSIFKEDM